MTDKSDVVKKIKTHTPKVDYDKKIKCLEEELLRKEEIIEKLKKDNSMLFKTALKNSERKVDTKLKKTVEHKREDF